MQKFPGGDGRERGGTEVGRKGPCTCPCYRHFQGLFGLVGYVQGVSFWVLSLQQGIQCHYLAHGLG